MLEQLGLNVEQINNIIMTLIVAFTGTGIVGLAVKVAINKSFKFTKNKIAEAVSANKISQKNADDLIEHLKVERDFYVKQADVLNYKVDEFLKKQATTDKTLNELAEAINTRDKKIADMLEKELTESEEE